MGKEAKQSRLERIRKVREKLTRDGTMIATKDGAEHDVRTVSITDNEGAALRDWIIREKAETTIEVGLAYGFSGLYVCEGLVSLGSETVSHTVLDPFQSTRFAYGGLQNLEAAGVIDLVTHHADLSHFVLPQFLKEGREFDLAFIDGNHRHDYVFLDLFYLGKLVRKGGIIMLDDTNLPGIEKAAQFFIRNLNWTIEERSPQDDAHSWIVLRTPIEEDARDFTFFVDF